jgi:hypothetical protein
VLAFHLPRIDDLDPESFQGIETPITFGIVGYFRGGDYLTDISMCWFKTNVKHLMYELTSHFIVVVEFFEDDPNGWMSRATANLNIGF